MAAEKEEQGDGIVREFGMDMYTLLYWKMDNWASLETQW